MKSKELQKKLDARRKSVSQIFDEAKTSNDDGSSGYDFRQVKCLGDEITKLPDEQKAIRVAEKVRELTAEVSELQDQYTTLKTAEDAAEAHDKQRSEVKRPPVDGRPGDQRPQRKSFGDIAREVTASDVYKRWLAGSKDGRIEIDATLGEAKTLLTSITGFPPEATRTGTLVDIPLRPTQVIDIMPRGQTGMNSVVWMGQTTRTQAAAETAEGGQKPEAALAFEERNSPVREISVFLPVTDIQLEDVPLVESLIETQLREDMDERLDGQIIIGDGVAPNLTGILNTTGIQTQAKGSDPVPDAIFKAGTKVRTGIERATPTHVLLHPNDWQELRLLRTADGVYILGDPQDAGQPRIWGWPVVENEELTEGTGLIGGFAMRNIGLFERRGVTLERGFVNDDFRRNQQSIRASMRAALAVFRPGGFATITGI